MESDIVLVTGSSGLVGSYLLPYLVSRYKFVYVSSHRLTPVLGNIIEVDLSNAFSVTQLLEKIQPDIIVNLAALTDVDACENHTDLAYQLNSQLPRFISEYIRKARHKQKSYLLHVSTDYVFNGYRGNYDEYSQPNPINFYGKTKLWGEQVIMNTLDSDEWCIVRISTPFGKHPVKTSFPMYVISKLTLNEQLSAVVDQYTSPSYSLDLARMLTEIIERKITELLNCAGSSRLSRYEQAIKVAKTFGLDSALITKSYCDRMKWVSKRPHDSSLDVSKAINILRYKPRSFDESMRDFGAEIKL
jgi:dTDP-4-dehydrorhamnose reductase